MNMEYAIDYKNRKNRLIEILDRAASLFNTMDKDDDETAMRQLIELCEKGRFSVVVVGAFSSGKSTMLNALMGERYLPSFRKETTATVNFLMSADLSPKPGEEVIVVNYNDGTTRTIEEVTLENIEKYVSVNGDNVAQTVKSVDIYLKGSKFLQDGVSLVDSPGLNGLAEGHTAITNQQIKESHAAIFMFDAHQSSGTKSDFDALKKLKDTCDSLLIVINQIDCINESEEQTIESVIDDLKSNYHKQFPDDPIPEIFPMAAYPALVYRSKRYDLTYNNEKCDNEKKKKLYAKSRIENFEERLWRFLTGSEKTKAEFTSPLDQVIHSLAELTNGINEEIEVIEGEKSYSDLLENKAALQKEKTEIENTIEEKCSDILPQIQDMIKDTKDRIKGGMTDIRKKYLENIERTVDIDLLKQGYGRYASRMNNEIQELYSEEVRKLAPAFSKLIIKECGKLSASTRNKIESNKPSEELSESKFNVDMTSFLTEPDLTSLFEKLDKENDEIEKLQDKSDELDIQLNKRDQISSKREKLERKLQQRLDEKNNELLTLGDRPIATMRTKTERRRTWGLWGAIKFIWNGNPGKLETTQEYDDSNVKDYETQREEIIKKYDNDRADKEQEIRNLEDKLSKWNSLDAEKALNERAIERATDKLHRLRKEIQEKAEKEKNKLLYSAKEYLSEEFDEWKRERAREIDSQIDGFDKTYSALSLDIIKSSYEIALEDKVKEIEKYEKLIQAGAKEKEDRRNFLLGKKKEIEDLQDEAELLKSEIESIETDTIKRT